MEVMSKVTVRNSGDIFKPVWATINRMTQIGSYLANEANICNKSDLITVCKWVGPQYTIDCFADFSAQEARTVTQKLDLDQMSNLKEHIHTDGHNVIKLDLCCQFGVYSLCMTLFG